MSSQYQPGEYLPTIDAILSVADLEKVSVKKIRNALQALFAIDLTPHKADINEIILGRYHHMVEEREKGEKDDEKRRLEMIKLDAMLALKLLKDAGSRTRQRPKKAKPATASGEIKKPGGGGGFNKEVIVSAELASIIGKTRTTRPQIVKALWVYIKAHDLQDPSDKREIICDDKLESLFKKKQVNAFKMNRDISSHIFKPEEVSGGDVPTVASPAVDSPAVDSPAVAESTGTPAKDLLDSSEEE